MLAVVSAKPTTNGRLAMQSEVEPWLLELLARWAVELEARPVDCLEDLAGVPGYLEATQEEGDEDAAG